MQINGLPQSLNTLTLESGNQFTQAWKVGEVLKVTAISDSTQGQVLLRAGKYQIRARTEQPISAGQQLELKVVSKQGRTVLQTVAQNVAPDVMGNAALRALPRQDSMQPLLANLMVLGKTPLGAKLPVALQQQISGGMELLSQRAAVGTQEGLKQALRDSGLFFEARMAQQIIGNQRHEPPADMKAFLLRLQTALSQWRVATPLQNSVATPQPDKPVAAQPPQTQPPSTMPAQTTAQETPPPQRHGQPSPQATQVSHFSAQTPVQQIHAELTQQVEAALARLQLHQLGSLPQAEDKPQAWLLELAVRNNEQTELFGLHVEQDASQTGAQQDSLWSVMLAFDLPGLGPVRARVSVSGEHASVIFWAEHENASRLFEQNLPLLQDQLQLAGLQVADLQCHCGRPVQTQSESDPSGLLDERA